MLDTEDDHEPLGVIDLIDDAINAASSRAHSRQFPLEGAADSMRVFEQCSEHEFDDRRCGSFGEPVELSFGGTRDPQSVIGFGTHLAR